MLQRQSAGRNDFWAIRWHASLFLAGKLSLFPGSALVRNIGFDGSGTHCRKTSKFDTDLAREPVRLARSNPREDPECVQAIRRYFLATRLHPRALLRRIREALGG